MDFSDDLYSISQLLPVSSFRRSGLHQLYCSSSRAALPEAASPHSNISNEHIAPRARWRLSAAACAIQMPCPGTSSTGATFGHRVHAQLG